MLFKKSAFYLLASRQVEHCTKLVENGIRLVDGGTGQLKHGLGKRNMAQRTILMEYSSKKGNMTQGKCNNYDTRQVEQ